MVRKKQKIYLEWVSALIFFALYSSLANAMEGLNFDTIFIAAFCTLLSTFVVRCAHGIVTGR